MLPRSILPPSYEQTHGHARRIELASDRVIREKNKASYRLNHWPIWIFVFFIAPGPMTFILFERGFDTQMAGGWRVVLIGTGLAGLFGKLPGVEPRPYIIRFTEDRPNPLYRRICYTMAWSEAITFAVLNIAGLVYAIVAGDVAAPPDLRRGVLSAGRVDLAARRARAVAAREALDQGGRARAALFLRLGLGGLHRAADPVADVEGAAAHATAEAIKLVIFVGILLWVGNMARRGLLPRTRPIVPGELAVSD